MKHGVPSVRCEAVSFLWQEGGFSLIELLIVLVIVVLLTGLYWNSNTGNRQRALQGSCQNNLNRLYVGLTLFANEHAAQFPAPSAARTSEEALDPLVPTYCSDTSVFICPGSKNSPLQPGQPLRSGKISYSYYTGRGVAKGQEALLTDAQVNTQAKAAGEPIFSSDGKSPGNNHGKYGGNLLFCDGHVELSTARTGVALPLRAGETLLNP